MKKFSLHLLFCLCLFERRFSASSYFAPEMMMKILMWCKYTQFKFHSEESQRVFLSVRLAFKKKITKEKESERERDSKKQIRVQVRCRYF